MSDPFVGEIRAVGFNFAPVGWLPCNGQLLPISQYQALFALLGTYYGGNGVSNFQLPDLRGRVAMSFNNDSVPGISLYPIGTNGGAESSTGAASFFSLVAANLPGHTHPATFTPTGGGGAGAQVNVTTAAGSVTQSPVGGMLTQSPSAGPAQAAIYAPGNSTVAGQLAGVSGSGGITGGTVAVQSNNTGAPAPVAIPGARVPVLQPFLAVNYIIAYSGIFPSRP